MLENISKKLQGVKNPERKKIIGKVIKIFEIEAKKIKMLNF